MNENLKLLEEDHLYHIALSTVQDDLRNLFGDVKVGSSETLHLGSLLNQSITSLIVSESKSINRLINQASKESMVVKISTETNGEAGDGSN